MDDLARARQLLHEQHLAFALVKRGCVLASGTRPGALELLESVDRLGEQTRGASLADKVVGKAVAAIAVQAGVTAVATPLASEPAVALLRRHDVTLHADVVVPKISNRTGDGICPLEQVTATCATEMEAVTALRAFFASKRTPPAKPD